MANPETNTADKTAKSGDRRQGVRLTKEQRKELLAQIERQVSRTESPERLLQRAEQSVAGGQLDQARRLLKHLDSVSPKVAGLPILKQRIREAEQAEQRKVNLQKAEEMLKRYIQERKKPLAELALETLIEIAPAHPRRLDYENWVADLDQELEMQNRLDREVSSGRTALRSGDIGQAREHLESLRQLDPSTAAELAVEVEAAEQGQAESADIERVKQRVEELLEAEQLDDAEREVERLASLDVPKLTVDFLRKRIHEARLRARDQADADLLTALFNRHFEARDWQDAREVAHRFGDRFPDRPEAALLFNRVTEMEAAERRQQSLEQGLQTLEKFIAEGKRQEAEVALKLLQRLNLAPQQLAKLSKRVAKL